MICHIIYKLTGGPVVISAIEPFYRYLASIALAVTASLHIVQ